MTVYTKLLVGCLLVGLSGGVAASAPPAMVIVVPVERRAVPLTQPLVGSIEPVRRTSVAAEEAGIVHKRHFDAGDEIDDKKVLVELKTDLLQAELDAARGLAAAAAADVVQAMAELENKRRELKRLKDLFEQRLAPDKEYFDAVSAEKAAEAAVSSRQGIRVQRDAEVARLELLIAKAQIRSPVAGWVARRHVEEGMWVGRGEPVADVVQMHPLFVRVNVPEGVVAKVNRGDPATVVFDALGGREVVGVVEQIWPEADTASRTVPLRILIENPDGKIRPGFFARVTLRARGEEELVVPTDAVITRDNRSHVVAVREGVAAIVPVERVRADALSVAVRGALKPGEMVVIRGNESLFPGAPLIPVPAGGPPGGGPPGGRPPTASDNANAPPATAPTRQ